MESQAEGDYGPGDPITFVGPLADTDLEQMTIDASALTGGTATIATTVPGAPGAAVEKFSPSGQFLLIFGSHVNKNGANVCDAGEECQPGTPGSAPGAFQGTFTFAGS